MQITDFLLNTTFALFCGYSTHLLMLKYMPFIYNIFLYSCLLNAVYCYTQVEFYSKKTLTALKNNSIVSYLIQNNQNLKNKVEVIKLNHCFLTYILPALIQSNYNTPIDYDFIMLSYYNDDNIISVDNKVILYKIPSNEACINYTICNYKFISLSILTDGETYKIELSSEYINYYVDGNVLNAIFFCYLLKQQHNVDYNKYDIKYTLNIIDHNVNIINLNELDVILLKKIIMKFHYVIGI